MKIGFLYNHEQIHQVLHSAPIAFEMSRLHPDIEVRLIISSDTQFRALSALARDYPDQRCHWIRITLPPSVGWLCSRLSGCIPVEKVVMLKANAARLADLDALVVTEKTSLMLKSHFGLSNLRFIHTRHGAGDRDIGFDKNSGKFDLVLLSGRKIRDRLLAAGQLRNGHYAIAGYPKFAAVHALEKRPLKLFDNDRPTVLYNPHCSSELSSWYKFGQDILEYFYHSDKYNLIFAPHIMLFQKRLQASLHSWHLRAPGTIRKKHLSCEHMHIDTGSLSSTDMSYTMTADLYLGDVSSQVYEFLVKPRPCVFANPGVAGWEDDPNYLCWKFGPVLDRIEQLDETLEKGFARHQHYLPVQKRNFAYTFDNNQVNPSLRSVRAIVDYMHKEVAWPAQTIPGVSGFNQAISEGL